MRAITHSPLARPLALTFTILLAAIGALALPANPGPDDNFAPIPRPWSDASQFRGPALYSGQAGQGPVMRSLGSGLNVVQWDFNGNLAPTMGPSNLVSGFAAPAGIAGVTFTNATIGGQTAQVAAFTRGTWFQLFHAMPTNGGGLKLNRYTLIMDVMFPTRTSYTALLQTSLANGDDGDWFINPNSDTYTYGFEGSTVPNGVWHRLALVVDGGAGTFRGYVDGVLAINVGVSLDGAAALASSLLLFADENSENDAGFINSVQLRDVALDAATIALFGGPQADGIPVVPVDQGFVCDNWLAEGPGIAFGGDLNMPGRPAVGCVSAIAAHPTDANIIYAAGVNGGVWRTTNATSANIVWTPLTDSEASLSIGALAMDPSDPTGRTLVAGYAQQTSFGVVAGALNGLIRTTNGGASWTPLGVVTLANENIMSIAARGNIILAGSEIMWASGWNANAKGTGLFRSTDAGATFALVSGSGGLPAGAITHLTGDPGNSSRFYVHVQNNGVYRSDNSGSTWTPVNSGVGALAGANVALGVSQAGSTNAVFAVTIAAGGRGVVSQIFRSTNSGVNWTVLDSVNVNAWSAHSAFAADPLNPSICYLAGEWVRSPFPFSGYAVRVDASKTPGTQVTVITSLSGLGTNTAPHTDARAMAFDPSGNLIEADDGGIYLLPSPQTAANGAGPNGWRALFSSFGVAEYHSVAYDSVAKVVIAGAQDNGVQTQRRRGSSEFDVFLFNQGGLFTGDGGDVAVDSTSTPGFSLRYFSVQNLSGFSLNTYDASNNLVSQVFPPRTPAGGSPAIGGQFVTPTVLNAINPVRLLIGGNNGLYESLDRGSNITRLIVNVPNQNARMAYGGRRSNANNPDVLYFGSGTSVFIRTNSVVVVTNTPTAFPGTNTIRGVVLNTEDWATAYVLTTDEIFVTANAGASWTSIIGNLTGVGQYRTLEFLPLASGFALAVGTDKGVYLSRTNSLGTWKRLGDSLPNTPVMDLDYDPVDNLLVAGTFGRGAWSFNLSDTPVNFFTITSLANEGSGSLRDAIIAANNNGCPAVIQFATNGTITLNSPLPPVTVNLTLDGNGTNLTILSGGNESQLLTFNAGTTNVLRNLTLANGTSAGFAAGIVNHGTLTLANTVVSNCVALASLGGAIYNGGSLTASNTLFTANTIYGGAGNSGSGNSGPGGGGAGMGGAIFHEGTAATFINCNFTRNTAVGGNGATGDANGFNSDPGANGGGPNPGLGGPVGNPGDNGGFGGGGGGGAGSFNSGGFAGGAGGLGGGGGGGGANGGGGSGGTGGDGGLYGGVGGAAQSSHSGGGGGGAGLGGAIFVRSGTIDLSGCSFVQNSATNGNGGIGSFGGGNGAAGQGLGGAILNYGGSLCLGGSTLTGNTASTANPNIAFGPTGGLVADGQTCVVDGFTFDLSTNTLFVGKSGPNTTLIITNGGMVFNGDGTIGDFGGSINNLVLVTGGGSVWSNTGALKVGGAFVSGNRLVVSNAARVTSATGIIGSQSDSNSALVTGSGSVWTNSGSLFVGSAGGTGNQLTVAGGGEMDSGSAFVGYNPGVNNNNVLVTGSNSLLRLSSFITVGLFGSANRLVISNGATALSPAANIGGIDGAVSNVALITGAGSRWLNTGTMNAGLGGASSQLLVNNNGAMANANPLTLGANTTSTNNLLAVAGGSVLVTNGTLDVRRGSVLFNGGSITTDNLLVTNPVASSFTFNDGTLVTRAATIANGANFLVGVNAGTPAAGAAFANGSLVSIPFFGPATPYPSTLNVSNLVGGITKVTVTISNLAHTFPADLEMLLVSPGGESVILMSSAGGGGPGVSGVTVTFDDAAATPVPQVNYSSGTYRPTNYFGAIPPLPAPQGPHGSTLATLNGLNPNGPWSLFVHDHSNGDQGRITNGWSLNIVTAPAATWDVRSNAAPTTVTGELHIGENGSNARLLVTNGATLFVSEVSYVGTQAGSSNNLVVVSGPNSAWTNGANWISVGQNGSFNTLLITNGGRVQNNEGYIGAQPGAHDNRVVVAGVNSAWQNSAALFVGYWGSSGALVISNSGTVQALHTYVGFLDGSAVNRLTVAGGTLRSTNVSGTSELGVSRGTNVLDAGLIEVDHLVMNNPLGFFEFNGGTLNARTANVANGAVFTVGNGSSAATYHMSGLQSDNHLFNNGLTIANNAILTGNGSLLGLTVLPGGTVSPGASIGSISLNSTPTLQGQIIMEIAKNGATLTKDFISVGDNLIYGGALTVTNLGPTALALGDSFQIFFSFDFYGGAFTSISLPPLPAGLKWSNQLLANGSIAVVAKTAPQISGLTKSGTNLIYNVTGGSPGAPWYRLTATNVALPLANWTTNGTGVFDWVGNATITNGINFAEPQRYFRISAP